MDLKKETRELIITFLILASIIGVVVTYQIYQGMVVSEGLVSNVEISELRISPDGSEILEGYWVATLVVDQRDEMIFTIRPTDAEVDLAEDPSRNIPPGSKIVSPKGISVVLRPLGDPYVHGAVRRAGIAYDDGGDPSKTRLWEYYSLASPSWIGVHVPYQVIIKDTTTGTLLADKSFLSGGTDWDTREKVLLPQGIELMNLGQLWTGLLVPPSDIGYIFNVGGTPQFVQESLLHTTFLANPPGAQEFSLEVSDVQNGDTSVLDKNRVKFRHQGWGPQDDAWGTLGDDTLFQIIGWNPQTKAIEAKVGFADETFYGRLDVTIELTIASAAKGFNIDRMNVVATSESGTVDVHEGVVDVSYGRFSFGIRCEANGTATIAFRPIGAADEWDEFLYQSKIWLSQRHEIAESRIETDPYRVPLLPSWVDLWRGRPSLYMLEVPVTTYHPGTFPSVNTGEVVVWMMPGTSVRAFVQIKAPTSVFDSVIFRPPFGKPVIIGVPDITIEGGGQTTLVATVRNDGYTEDTFIPTLDLPEGMLILSPAGDKSVPVGTTESFEWVVAVGDVETARTESATLRVVAKNSLLDDSKDFSVSLEPGQDGPIKTGDLIVTVLTVLDDETVPLAGAEVSIAGLKDITGTDGVATIHDIREGDQRFTVSLEGYGTYSEDIYISEGTNYRTVRLGSPDGLGIPLFGIIAIFAIIVVIVMAYVGKRRGWF